jgi:plastocyanin domain-containing protein
MKNKNIFFGVLVAVILVGGVVWYALAGANNNSVQSNLQPSSNISVVDGKQFIDITAKGGYAPRTMVAKAGLPTVLRVKTQGTFDCSSGLTIPKLNYQKSLPATGLEEITVNPDQAQGTLQGVCGMGMYSFKIAFSS